MNKEKLVSKITDILAYQASITSQGKKYTGEKDWALNRILSLIEKDREEILEKASHCFFPYCDEPSCYDKLKEIITDNALNMDNILRIAYGNDGVTLNKGDKHMVLTNEDMAFIVQSVLKNVPLNISITN